LIDNVFVHSLPGKKKSILKVIPTWLLCVPLIIIAAAWTFAFLLNFEWFISIMFYGFI